MDALESGLSAGPSLKDMATYFYDRDDETEQTLCLPWISKSSHGLQETSYTIRYPEFKPDYQEWVIRQTGIYQIVDTIKSSNVYVVLEPQPGSRLTRSMEKEIRVNGADFRKNPLWLHSLVLSVYCQAWRSYILSLENRLLPIADKTFATFIHQPLNIGYEALGTLVGLKDKFNQTVVMLDYLAETLKELRAYSISHLSDPESEEARTSMIHSIDNHERARSAQSQSAKYLRQRTQDMVELLSHTLSFRYQVVAAEQNKSMLQLNKSAVFITAVALLYLPSSWLAVSPHRSFFLE